jgi:transcriptional regulator with XRE-family HTH domain
MASTTRPQPAVDQRLGRWLRAVRRSTRPHDVGLTPGPRHRHPWLSQVELARLAGLTPRAYQGVEQGRRKPGPRLLDGVADALQFTDAQRSHLHRLAGPGAVQPSTPPERPLIRRLIHAYSTPAVAYDHLWNVVTHNNAFARALPDLAARDKPNLLIWFFTSTEARELFVDWEHEASQLIARFRTVQGYYADPRPFDELAEQLSAASPLAGRLWSEGAVVVAEPPTTVRRVRGVRGVYSTTTVILQPNGATDPSVRIATCIL